MKAAKEADGASKAAMNAMGQSLAVALAPYGITVAGVAPGFIETDMVREHLEGPAGDAIRAQSPFHRVAEPAEVRGRGTAHACDYRHETGGA